MQNPHQIIKSRVQININDILKMQDFCISMNFTFTTQAIVNQFQPVQLISSTITFSFLHKTVILHSNVSNPAALGPSSSQVMDFA